MMTIHEVSELAGVSIRTLQYYDKIGLLRPEARTEAGWRLYGECDLVRLQQILLFRELEFPLKAIKSIMDNPAFDQSRALQQQIELLELRREHLDNLIELAKRLKAKEAHTVSFEPFDTSKIDEYARRAKEAWGESAEWKEFESKSATRTKQEEASMGEELMGLFKPFATMAANGDDPSCDAATAQAEIIQTFITEHFYTCTNDVFLQLGRTYGSGGEFTRNIDNAAGAGTGAFAMRAIEAYLANK